MPKDIFHNLTDKLIGQSFADIGVPSIWEKELIRRFHEDDIVEKFALELQFISFIKTLPCEYRQGYYLQHVLRMKDSKGEDVYVTHRIFYLRYDNNGNVLLALCLQRKHTM